MMVRRFAVALTLLGGAVSSAADVTAYRIGRLWDGKNPVVEESILVVTDGKITAVGPASKTQIPAGAKTVDLSAAAVIPGLVSAESTLTEVGRDDVRTLRPDLRAADGLDDYADHSKILAGGVTTMQATPGARRLITGVGAVFKLAGDPGTRIIRDTESLRVNLTAASRQPPTVYEPAVGPVSVDRPLDPTKKQPGVTLPGAVSVLRGLFKAARNPGSDPIAEAVAPFLKENAIIRIDAENAAEIRAAIQFAEAEKINVYLYAPKSLEPFKNSFARWKGRVKGVLLTDRNRPGQIVNAPTPERGEPRSKETWAYAKAIAAAGIPVAVTPTSDLDADDLLYQAGLFLRGGWTEVEALSAVTSVPAKLLGVADRVGSLEVGKDADFVVLTNDPFAVSTSVRNVYVNGKSVYDKKEADATTRISASNIWTGGKLLKDGSLLVKGKTVRAVGDGGTIGESGDGIRFPSGSYVVPGFIDLGASLGLDGPASGVSMSTKFSGKLSGSDRSIAEARRGGVTTTLLWPGGDNFAVVAFKLNNSASIVKEPAAIAFNADGAITATGDKLRNQLKSGKDYHESFLKYDAAMVEYEKLKKEYDAAKAKADAEKKPKEKKEEKKEEKKAEEKKEEKPAEKKDAPKTLSGREEGDTQVPSDTQPPDQKKIDTKPGTEKKEEKKEEKKPETKLPPEPKAPTKPTVNDGLEPYRLLFTGKIPAMVEVRKLANIEQAAKIFRDEFKVRTVFVGVDDAFRRSDSLVNKDLAFALTPDFVREVDFKTVNLPQMLALQSLPIAFQSRATTGVRELPNAVRYSVRKGLGSDDALVGLTSGPAKFLGLDSIGSLEPGKDADLVVFSGPPFALASRVLAVMIDGKWVYKAEEDR